MSVSQSVSQSESSEKKILQYLLYFRSLFGLHAMQTVQACHVATPLCIDAAITAIGAITATSAGEVILHTTKEEEDPADKWARENGFNLPPAALPSTPGDAGARGNVDWTSGKTREEDEREDGEGDGSLNDGSPKGSRECPLNNCAIDGLQDQPHDDPTANAADQK